MDLCSLQEVTAVSKVLEWPAHDACLKLKVIRDNVPFDLLRSLENLGITVETISNSNQPELQKNFTTGEAGVVNPDSEITLKLPREVNQGVVAKDLSDLFTISSTAWKHPKTYLLLAEGEAPQEFCYVNQDSLKSAPHSVKNYHAALSFWTLLQDQAIYVTDTQTLVFYRLRRLEIYPGFALGDLNDKLPEALEKIQDFVGDKKQKEGKETRSEIFRSVLSEFLRDAEPEKAFSYLVARSESFARRLGEGLAIYLSDNSPEKLSKQAVAKHFELAEKLEKVISGMEARSLTIPVAVLFAVKEMKPGEGLTTLNVIILISTLLYLIAMFVGYLSQKQVLGLLEKTIKKAKQDLLDQGLKAGEPVLAESFGNLEKRLKNTTHASLVMVIVSAVPLIAALYIGFLASPPPEPPKKWPEMHIIPASVDTVAQPFYSAFAAFSADSPKASFQLERIPSAMSAQEESKPIPNTMTNSSMSYCGEHTTTRSRVLLVEDDKALRRYLEFTLVQAGYEVIPAADGLEGMKIALSSSVDIVITDAMMPHLSGHEFCRFLRNSSHLSHIPIVMLSGSEPGMSQELADVFLSKPMSAEQLTSCLEELLRQS